MKASSSMSLSSYLKCNLVPRRGVAVDPYDGPQPQTATCCTALQRGFAADGGLWTQPRYAPLRTPGSAALLQHDDPIEEEEEEEEQQQQITPSKKKTTATKTMIKKMVRKCKSSVADVDVSQLIEGQPRLRRSGAVRRDWSFEDLRASHKAA